MRGTAVLKCNGQDGKVGNLTCRGNSAFLLSVAVLALLVWPDARLLAQQSTTGPIPPPGLDRGLEESKRSQKVISGVPSYIWHHGCGPTALGMVVGFWDANGYPNLVQDDASWQTAAVDAMIADDSQWPYCGGPALDHYQDYSCPEDASPGPLAPDRSETGGAHTSNCVADFMHTSWSVYYNYYGWSWFDDVGPSFTSYVNLVSPSANPQTTDYVFADFTWAQYKAEIDSRRPVVLLVDTDGDGATDHFVTGIGYDDQTTKYGIYDTWDHQVHWYLWRAMGAGKSWAIYGLTTLHVDYACTDSDGDGFGDPGHPENICPTDNCPSIYNFGQEDVDHDGLGDVCDPDIDNDGLANAQDNCPYRSNPDQDDSDSDGVGDLCDNCMTVPNPGQEDENDDGVGDACDGSVHIWTYTLPNGYLGEPYYQELVCGGGVSPYNWSKISGQVPYGTIFNGGPSASIAGTPNYASTFYFRIKVEDSGTPPKADTMSYSITVSPPPYICGDANSDDRVNVADAVYIINYVFVPGSPAPDPLISADVNCDTKANVADAVYIINHVFVPGSPAPCANCP